MNNTSLDTSQALERKIRLKQLMDKAADLDSTLAQLNTLQTLEAVNKIISTSDGISEEGSFQDRAEHSTEVVLDVQVLKMGHELVSKVLQQSSDFNDHIYQNAINRLIDVGEEVQWNVITDIACGIARTVRAQSSMLGAIEKQLQERTVKQRQQRNRTILAQEKRPELVEKLTRQDKGAQKVNIIKEQLRELFNANRDQPIPYFKLIIDPNDFMNTVENAFQMAFLARDNVISIATGSDNYPEVRLLRNKELQNVEETSQSMCTLNIHLCQEMIVFYNIKEPMLRVNTENTGGTT